MFKYIIILIVFAGVVITPFYINAAVEYDKDGNILKDALKPIKITNGIDIETASGLINIIISVLNFVYVVLFSASILFILLAAYTYLTAQDDPEKIKSATRQIMWASVAIAAGLLSAS